MRLNRRELLVCALGVGVIGHSGFRIWRATRPPKRVALFGDSMMELNTIPALVAEATGAAISSCAVGGASLSKHYDASYDAFSLPNLSASLLTDEWQLIDAATVELTRQGDDNSQMVREMKGVATAGTDTAVVWFGTNDFIQGKALGEVESYDPDTFNGAINVAVQNFRTWQPRIDLIFVTPVFRPRQEPDDGKNSDDFPNKSGIMLNEYADAIIDAGKRLGFRTIDMLRHSGIGASNSRLTISDGVHLSEEGQKMAASLIAATI